MDSYEEFVRLVEEHGLKDSIKISKIDCMGLCCLGPIVIVYPDNVWYCRICPCHNVQRVFHEHLVGGQVVEDLLVPEWVLPDVELPAECPAGGGACPALDHGSGASSRAEA